MFSPFYFDICSRVVMEQVTWTNWWRSVAPWRTSVRLWRTATSSSLRNWRCWSSSEPGDWPHGLSVTHKQDESANEHRRQTVNKAGVTDEAFSHNLSQWTLSVKLFSSYESVSQQHEALMTVYFILSKYTGSEMSHSCLTAIYDIKILSDLVKLMLL